MVQLPAVQEQYETFPYPPRDPAQEKQRLLSPFHGHLALANHIFWAGRRTLDANFHVLDAGCGTGDIVIFMAEQLRAVGGRVVALDFSQPSLDVVRARADVRGLTNIDYIRASIEEIATLDLPPFDYITSSGVLHHLASPVAGLTALRQALKPDGGMGIMVYGRYGRTAVYQLQTLLDWLAPADWPTDRRLRVTKQVLERLPSEHWAKLGADLWQTEWRNNGDAGLYDLLLHSQDRSYTVPELYEWMEAGQMQLARFDIPLVYDPAMYDATLDVAHLSQTEREAAAELLLGRMHKHHFFAAPAAYALPVPAAADDETAIPAWLLHDPDGETQRTCAETGLLSVQTGMVGTTIQIKGPGPAIVRRIDGRTSLGAILDAVEAELPALKREQIRTKWLALARELLAHNVVGLNRAA